MPQFVSRYSQALRGRLQQRVFLQRKCLHAARPAGPKQCFPKQLAIGGVDKRVRGKDASQLRQRPAGSEKQGPAVEFITLLIQLASRRIEGLTGELTRFCLHPRDEGFSLRQRLLLRGVIGLPELRVKAFDEMRPPAQQYPRRAVLKRYGDERRPSGVNTEAQGCRF